MSQKYLIRIAELERLLSEQAEALHRKPTTGLAEETDGFCCCTGTVHEEKIWKKNEPGGPGKCRVNRAWPL
ncbi:hypothetical protein NYV49_17930 [Escherichia coli]|nr:hypothetical protein [Escherichia coli]